MKELIRIFFAHFKVGMFSIGGGMALVPMLIVEFEKNGWLTESQFYDILAIAQMTPGAIAVNAATYVGNDLDGIGGAVAATAGIMMPSIILISLLMPVLSHMKNSRWKHAIFSGINPIVVALILFVAASIVIESFVSVDFIGEKSLRNISNIISFSVQWQGLAIVLFWMFVLWKKPRFSPILIILISSLVSIFIF